MTMLLAVILVLVVSGTGAFLLWRKNHEKIAIALSLAALPLMFLARPLERFWDALADDSATISARWTALPVPSRSSGAPTEAASPAPTREASAQSGRAPTGWKITYHSAYRLADRWGSDFDSADPTFNSGVAAEGGRPETADIRYVARPASSEAVIDNNNNPAVGIKAVTEGVGAAGCLTQSDYTDSVDARRYPHVCVRTTAGNFVYFHADAYNVNEVKVSGLEIMRR